MSHLQPPPFILGASNNNNNIETKKNNYFEDIDNDNYDNDNIYFNNNIKTDNTDIFYHIKSKFKYVYDKTLEYYIIIIAICVLMVIIWYIKENIEGMNNYGTIEPHTHLFKKNKYSSWNQNYNNRKF